jgi:hypothetical protein
MAKPEPVPAIAPVAKTPREIPIPPDLEEQIHRSSAIGRQLYMLDQVAAFGTDVMRAHVPNPRSRRIRGYLPLRESDENGNPLDSFRVPFFTDEAPSRITCEVRFPSEGKPEFQAFDPPKVPLKGLAELFHARQLAIAALPGVSQGINPVVIPGAANGENGILVYLLAGTTKPDVAVLGRHFRALVPINGRDVTYMMPLSNTVLELPTRDPNGEKAVALAVTHFVTDFPLETHVFTSLLVKMPIYVGTKRGIWLVEGDKISLFNDKDTAPIEI